MLAEVHFSRRMGRRSAASGLTSWNEKMRRGAIDDKLAPRQRYILCGQTHFYVARKKLMKNTSQQEEEKEFLAAYDEHSSSLFRFLTMKIADREVARDLTQETFTRAWDFRQNGGVI